MDKLTKRIIVDGHVQGVGFRPFIYRLAHQYQMHGWVVNLTGIVEIVIEGAEPNVISFIDGIISQAPPLAEPRIIEESEFPALINFCQFIIKPSESNIKADVSLPPDYFICVDCVKDLRDPKNHRYSYPFINCTQCGPRYTIIKDLPYDRPVTTMADFEMCDACQAEYSNPLDRRFHAQPIACADCGPTINFVLNDGSQHCKGENALIKAVDALKSGQIIAVKGIGGYHICCDATNDYAVLELRRRKKRSDKPLAVLFPSLGDDEVECLNDFVNLTIAQQILVQHPQRPIVIMDQPVKGLSQYITPTLQGVGAMLPYSPLHYLLLDQLKLPIVATSANISGEPVMTDNDEVEQRLSGIVDGFLHHNRPIHRPADDSVYRIVNHKAYPIRLGRGISPLELRLPFQFEQPCLAVGAFTKNTIALGWDDRMVVSPHIGDLESLKSQDVFEKVIDDLQSLYRVQPEIVLCDAHLSYPNSRWAKKQGISVNTIFHHFAHASALYGEHRHQGDLIVFAWDGVGLGVDGTLWGGETLVGQPATWQHTGQLRQFKLPGNDKVARQPWRSAVSIGWELDLDVMPMTAEISLLKQAWVKNINSPVTSAVGRLFDAASCLIGLGDNVSFEGQGPMQLESICQQGSQWIDLPITHTQDIEEIDWAPLVDMLLDDSKSQEYRSMMFHNSLVRSLLALAIRMRERFGISDVGLTGGVFQNKRLVENAVELLKINGFNVLLASKIPCNDAGISFGQLMEWGAKHGQ